MVAAVLERDGQVFVQQRQPGKHMAGLWEFPGGKIEAGEAPWPALQRELLEELGIHAERGEPLIALSHTYPDRRILLDVWRVTAWRGDPQAVEGQVIAWPTSAELANLPLLPADWPVCHALSLPHRVLVTPNCQSEQPAHLETFLRTLEQVVVARKLTLCILRQTNLSDACYGELATEAQALLAAHGVALILHGGPHRFELAESLSGRLHLPARYAAHVPQLRSLRLSMSCHTLDELRAAYENKCEFALLGAVLPTPTHPGGQTLGWRGFRERVQAANVPVYAIGGMQSKDVVRSRLEGAQGIAAISAFWPAVGK